MPQASPNQSPDYHFLLIAPNLGAEWLFDAARSYWERFTPTILPDFNFLALLPPDKTVIVTVICRRDTSAQLGVQLAQIDPNAYYDAVVFDIFEDAKNELNRRASLSQPFGVPLIEGSPTPTGTEAFIPTPRLFPTNPPAGFITEVPATPTPSPTPALSPVPSEDQPVPLSPTPGSIFGS
ncbi:MAG TPA: hypothetical protein VHD90_24660 [Phototrophicaceae bacterium]|nr:hypothetical protein [Phototrophicaceae bacterium]HWB53513.1 hypothetical protein [Tepidisphaeraceae bacterium]